MVWQAKMKKATKEIRVHLELDTVTCNLVQTAAFCLCSAPLRQHNMARQCRTKRSFRYISSSTAVHVIRIAHLYTLWVIQSGNLPDPGPSFLKSSFGQKERGSHVCCVRQSPAIHPQRCIRLGKQGRVSLTLTAKVKEGAQRVEQVREPFEQLYE